MSKRSIKISLFVLFIALLVSLILVWMGQPRWLPKGFRRLDLSEEARKNVTQLSMREHDYAVAKGVFLSIRPSVANVPRGRCVSTEQLGPEFLEDLRTLALDPAKPISVYAVDKIFGAPCFRYRYETIVCPGSAECETRPYVIGTCGNVLKARGSCVFIEGRGDLDGDGDIICGDGFYIERRAE